MLSLGTYPDVARKAARARRDESPQSLAAGIDPSDARKAAQAASAGRAEAKTLAGAGKPGVGTFEHVARDGLATVHEAKVSEGHAEQPHPVRAGRFPWLGRPPIADIEAPELLDCLRRVTARGAIETAHRLKDTSSIRSARPSCCARWATRPATLSPAGNRVGLGTARLTGSLSIDCRPCSAGSALT